MITLFVDDVFVTYDLTVIALISFTTAIFSTSVPFVTSVIAANIARFGNYYNTLLCAICKYENYLYLCSSDFQGALRLNR